ncbi:unnamed protein product [Rhodiola kirilowii]
MKRMDSEEIDLDDSQEGSSGNDAVYGDILTEVDVCAESDELEDIDSGQDLGSRSSGNGDGQGSETKSSSENEAVDEDRLTEVDGYDESDELEDIDSGQDLGNGSSGSGEGSETGYSSENESVDEDRLMEARRNDLRELLRKDGVGRMDFLLELGLSHLYKDPVSAYLDMKAGLIPLESAERKAAEEQRQKRVLARERCKSLVRKVHEESQYSSEEQEELLDEDLNLSGPFASAFKKIKDQVDGLKKCEQQPLVNWVPAKEQKHRSVPSLVDLSMDVLARNSELVSSLDCVPYEMREMLSSLVCDYRKMDSNFFRLLVAGSPEEISVKDCSWMTIHLFEEIFGNCDLNNLKVLRLDLCGQCVSDFTLFDAFARSSPHSLETLSLKGAAGLTEEGLASLTLLAPSLKSINLSEFSLITAQAIYTIAKTYGSSLKELYLDECPMIDAMLMLPSLMDLKSLEVLSVAGVPTVTDEFVVQIAEVCGSHMKEWRLADCLNLTDKSIEVLGAKCPNITFLDLSNLNKLSDLSLQYITHGCRSIRHLKLHRNRFRFLLFTNISSLKVYASMYVYNTPIITMHLDMSLRRACNSAYTESFRF